MFGCHRSLLVNLADVAAHPLGNPLGDSLRVSTLRIKNY